MAIKLCLVILFFLIITGVFSTRIKNLPGLPESIKLPHISVDAKSQFSGYVPTSATHFLHYWVVNAAADPFTKPVILWMNGGPGCSSLVGYLAEMGPFLVNKDGKSLSPNPWSWNEFANIIYLEAPAGVGYSYSTDGNTTTDDDQTSLENYKALKLIFKKFPKFMKLDFYIAGQSYGGIYAPTLAKRVIDGIKEFSLNFKGVLIGNGLLDGSLNLNTFFEFANMHGLLSDQYWLHIKSACYNNQCSDDSDFVTHRFGDMCSTEFNELWVKMMLDLRINVYDVSGSCYYGQNIIDEYGHLENLFKMLPSHIVSSIKMYLHKKLLHDKLERQTFLGSYPCWDDSAIKGYLGQKSVRKALLIPDKAPEWDTCRDWLNYDMTYFWISRAKLIKEIINFGAKVLLYYGDADLACNFMHAQQFATHLKLQMVKDKSPWFYKGQNAGFITRYQGLDMCTIKGAGHMAPADRRPQTFELVQKFILGKEID